ncbi:hypothetical protein [Bosea sp. (in: a-proteobacteria)]|uniref:hypothetical protein n=1 Tax=Bosea sp. (in: a-proteobacteria) TaxID=1871050 RepID=UPI001ACDA6F0|nr:hypothetical protein [Bosea sp. (in: a-proteobacteria)]MBN9439524.1 hypothetical protein [Bosea sp. (in: a-proteobacteria)]
MAAPGARSRNRKAFALKPSILTSLRRYIANMVLQDFTAATTERLSTLDQRLATTERRLNEILDEDMRQSEQTGAQMSQAKTPRLLEQRLRLLEERVRLLEPDSASAEAMSAPDAARTNLLNIRLGELESRIITVLEGPYFDRIAEHIRSERAERRDPAGFSS